MPNFLNVFMNVIKSKVAPIWTKLKLWTSKSYIQTVVVEKIRHFFSKTLSVKPRHKKDYYTVFRWLVSKRLAFALVLAIGVASLYYLTFIQPVSLFGGSGGSIRIYQYDSLALRFVNGKVKIKAKSGYIAYEGEVNKGKASGTGNLYDKKGGLVYNGDFEESKFNGMGKLYDSGGQLRYDGMFVNNLYEGTGILYRGSGSKEYEGSFSLGLKEGKGILYDAGGNTVFEGNFTKDRILYTDFLGKTTQEISEIYTGARTIYMTDEGFVVSLDDIDALYYGNSRKEFLDDSIMTEGVYVIDNSMIIGGSVCHTADELTQVFGIRAYEGNSEIKVPEAIAADKLNKSGSMLDPVNLITQSIYEDVHKVLSYEPDYYCYLYTYVKDDIVYTFFFQDRYGEFFLYLIQKETA